MILMAQHIMKRTKWKPSIGREAYDYSYELTYGYDEDGNHCQKSMIGMRW